MKSSPERSSGGSRGRSKSGVKTGQTTDPVERAETHRRNAGSRKGGATGGAARASTVPKRRSAVRASQRHLPFEGVQASLRARLRPEMFTRLLVRIGATLLVLLLAGALLMVIYSISHGLRLFALREVVVHRHGSGRELISDQEIDQLVRKVVPEGVLRVDLRRIRSELLQHDYIREAQVRRLLPDTLSLQITERVPMALAHLEDGTVRSVDEDGTLFGTAALFRGSQTPPLIRGLVEESENAAAINRRHLAVYQALMADLDRLDPQLSPVVDAILLSESEGVRVILANSGTTVFLGREDYRRRLNLALDLLDAVRRKDLDAMRIFRLEDVDRLLGGRKVEYVNTTNATRITVGFNE